MRKLIATALLALALGGCTLYERVFPPTDAEIAWRIACSYEDCTGIEPPQVVVSDKIFTLNWSLMTALGFYFPGEDTIYVRATAKDEDLRMGVLIHEIVHYITDNQGRFPLACDNEANAFRVADEYFRSIGRDDLVRGEDWWIPYGNCQNYGPDTVAPEPDDCEGDEDTGVCPVPQGD